MTMIQITKFLNYHSLLFHIKDLKQANKQRNLGQVLSCGPIHYIFLRDISTISKQNLTRLQRWSFYNMQRDRTERIEYKINLHIKSSEFLPSIAKFVKTEIITPHRKWWMTDVQLSVLVQTNGEEVSWKMVTKKKVEKMVELTDQIKIHYLNLKTLPNSWT